MKQNGNCKFRDVPINAKQKAVIKMAQGKLLIDDETYRDMLEERYGVRSCTKLSFNQASEFIGEMEGKGFMLIPGKCKGKEKREQAAPMRRTRPPISRTDSKVIGLATTGEIEKVSQLAALIPWRVENGLGLFLEKRMKVKGGRIRTSQEAYLAIEGLKKLFENGMKKAHGVDWRCVSYADFRINEYIRIHKPFEWV